MVDIYLSASNWFKTLPTRWMSNSRRCLVIAEAYSREKWNSVAWNGYPWNLWQAFAQIMGSVYLISGKRPSLEVSHHFFQRLRVDHKSKGRGEISVQELPLLTFSLPLKGFILQGWAWWMLFTISKPWQLVMLRWPCPLWQWKNSSATVWLWNGENAFWWVIFKVSWKLLPSQRR